MKRHKRFLFSTIFSMGLPVNVIFLVVCLLFMINTGSDYEHFFPNRNNLLIISGLGLTGIILTITGASIKTAKKNTIIQEMTKVLFIVTFNDSASLKTNTSKSQLDEKFTHSIDLKIPHRCLGKIFCRSEEFPLAENKQFCTNVLFTDKSAWGDMFTGTR